MLTIGVVQSKIYAAAAVAPNINSGKTLKEWIQNSPWGWWCFVIDIVTNRCLAPCDGAAKKRNDEETIMMMMEIMRLIGEISKWCWWDWWKFGCPLIWCEGRNKNTLWQTKSFFLDDFYQNNDEDKFLRWWWWWWRHQWMSGQTGNSRRKELLRKSRKTLLSLFNQPLWTGVINLCGSYII